MYFVWILDAFIACAKEGFSNSSSGVVSSLERKKKHIDIHLYSTLWLKGISFYLCHIAFNEAIGKVGKAISSFPNSWFICRHWNSSEWMSSLGLTSHLIIFNNRKQLPTEPALNMCMYPCKPRPNYPHPNPNAFYTTLPKIKSNHYQNTYGSFWCCCFKKALAWVANAL